MGTRIFNSTNRPICMGFEFDGPSLDVLLLCGDGGVGIVIYYCGTCLCIRV